MVNLMPIQKFLFENNLRRFTPLILFYLWFYGCSQGHSSKDGLQAGECYRYGRVDKACLNAKLIPGARIFGIHATNSLQCTASEGGDVEVISLEYYIPLEGYTTVRYRQSICSEEGQNRVEWGQVSDNDIESLYNAATM